MNDISTIMFVDKSSVAFAADGSSITVTDAAGVAKVFTMSAPVVAPEDVEVDIKLSDGSTKTFVPKA